MDNKSIKQHNASLIQQLNDIMRKRAPTTVNVSTQTFPPTEHKHDARSSSRSPAPSSHSSDHPTEQQDSPSSPAGSGPMVAGFIIHTSKDFFVPITLDESKYQAVKDLPDDSVRFPIQVNVATPAMF